MLIITEYGVLVDTEELKDQSPNLTADEVLEINCWFMENKHKKSNFNSNKIEF